MEQKKTENNPANISLEARQVAARCIDLVVSKRRQMDVFFVKDQAFLEMSDQDRAFCRRIIKSTLRHFGELEASFEPYFDRPLGKSKSPVLAHIYLAAAQIAYEEIPPYAAINTAVELVKQHHKGMEKLANAALRRWLGDYENGFPAKPIANLPKWLRDKWQANYGATLEPIAAALTSEPPLDISFKELAARDGFVDRMSGDAIALGNSARVIKYNAVTDLPGFDAGNWWVQDVAATLPVYLLGDIKGKLALDMCAAPGGKAMQMAAMGANVVALDSQEARLAVMQENIERSGLEIETHAKNALSWSAKDTYDVILLDAPCSATGTLRRNPDVKYIRHANNLLDTVSAQAKLLRKGLNLLKPGGKLVYCVCSMEVEEGEEIIEALLAEEKGVILANNAELLPLPALDSGGLGFRTHPALSAEHGGMDGFFMTCLEKK